MVAVVQLPLGNRSHRVRSALACRVLYARLLLGADDDAEACEDAWRTFVEWSEDDLRAACAELELELAKRGKRGLGSVTEVVL